MDIDVRKGAEVGRIIFGEYNIHLKKDLTEGLFGIVDADDDKVLFSFEDIPNLIKALQKAQEVWGDK